MTDWFSLKCVQTVGNRTGLPTPQQGRIVRPGCRSTSRATVLFRQDASGIGRFSALPAKFMLCNAFRQSLHIRVCHSLSESTRPRRRLPKFFHALEFRPPLPAHPGSQDKTKAMVPAVSPSAAFAPAMDLCLSISNARDHSDQRPG